MTPGLERALIDSLVGSFSRSPLQRNDVHASDAELVRLPGTDMCLAVTTDAVVEEIEMGLYDDPYLIGWMTVVVNASDLAAVGAAPLGILLSETLPRGVDHAFLTELQRGIAEASRAHHLPVLGGDTNVSSQLQMGGAALGIVREPLLTRRGCQPGDAVFATAPLGLGAAYAVDRFGASITRSAARTAGANHPLAYQPTARLSEGQAIQNVASGCIDTSDGVIPALDELMRLNGVGVRLDAPLEELLHPQALRTVVAAGLPPWTMLAGPHGEFELLFTVPEKRIQSLLERAIASGWYPVEMGSVVAEPGLWLERDGREVRLDATAVRNLFTEVGGNVERYVAALRGLDQRAAVAS